MKKHWDRAAMRFASAIYLDRQRMLDVTFENGDHSFVTTESVLPGVGYSSRRPDSPGAPPDWAGMRIGETGDVLEVPASDSVVEIPWDRIRSLSDP